MMIFLLLLAAACHGVEGDAIVGHDLALADARFTTVPTDARIGYAPLPGARRTLSALELKRVAARFGVEGDFADLCFEYPARRLETGELLAGMLGALRVEGAQIEIVEFSLYAAPQGTLVFPLTGLSRPSLLHSDEPVLWRGYVEYTGKRKFPVWAKVRVSVEETRVIAAEDLLVGRVVEPSQVRAEKLRGFPSFQNVAIAVDQVAGHTLRRPVRKGAAVSLDLVEAAESGEVTRGQAVEVDVEAGLAHLTFEGKAVSGGSVGQAITVRNVNSGKTFTARVVGRGKVEVIAGGSE